MMIDMSGERGCYRGASIAPLTAAKHCSSLCSQSEGHDHVARMLQVRYRSAISPLLCGVFAIIFAPPSLCEQSELQCFAPFCVSEIRKFVVFVPCRRSL